MRSSGVAMLLNLLITLKHVHLIVNILNKLNLAGLNMKYLNLAKKSRMTSVSSSIRPADP